MNIEMGVITVSQTLVNKQKGVITVYQTGGKTDRHDNNVSDFDEQTDGRDQVCQTLVNKQKGMITVYQTLVNKQ